MRKLIISLLVLAVMAVPLCAEVPNLYYGPSLDFNDMEWGTGAASDIFGKWGVYVAVGLYDDGAKAAGISVDLMQMVRYCHLDYKWGDKVNAKILYLPAYDFSSKEFSHRMLLSVIEL